ncbi:MAG: hemolysin III family protein [Anaerolineae bacterium]|nr:hemolysin III family protein [Anaerolineae bacterium]
MQRFREPVNGFTHLFGVFLGFIGLIWLVIATHDHTAKLLSVVIYGVSVIVLYSASTTFHLVKGSEKTVFLLRRIDHAAIYIMIAGTYTPIVYNILSGYWRWGMLAAIWSLAVIGIVYKLLFLQGNRNHLSTILYVAMGWMALLIFPKAIALMPLPAIVLVVAGGLVYTMGAVIFALQKPNFHRYFGHHELWHLFVLGGSALHFAAIAGYII